MSSHEQCLSISNVVKYYFALSNLYYDNYLNRWNSFKSTTSKLKKFISDYAQNSMLKNSNKIYEAKPENEKLSISSITDWFREYLFMAEYQNFIQSGEISNKYFENLVRGYVKSDLKSIIHPTLKGHFDQTFLPGQTGANCDLCLICLDFFNDYARDVIVNASKDKKFDKSLRKNYATYVDKCYNLSDQISPNLNELKKTLEVIQKLLQEAASHGGYFNKKDGVYLDEKLYIPAASGLKNLKQFTLCRTNARYHGSFLENLPLIAEQSTRRNSRREPSSTALTKRQNMVDSNNNLPKRKKEENGFHQLNNGSSPPINTSKNNTTAVLGSNLQRSEVVLNSSNKANIILNDSPTCSFENNDSSPKPPDVDKANIISNSPLCSFFENNDSSPKPLLCSLENVVSSSKPDVESDEELNNSSNNKANTILNDSPTCSLENNDSSPKPDVEKSNQFNSSVIQQFNLQQQSTLHQFNGNADDEGNLLSFENSYTDDNNNGSSSPPINTATANNNTDVDSVALQEIESITFVWVKDYESQTFLVWKQFSKDIMLHVETDLRNISIQINTKHSIDCWVKTKNESFDLWYRYISMFFNNNTPDPNSPLNPINSIRVIASTIVHCFLNIEITKEKNILFPLKTLNKFNLYHILYVSKYRYDVDQIIPHNIALLGLICLNDATFVMSYDGSKILKNKKLPKNEFSKKDNLSLFTELVKDNDRNPTFSLEIINTVISNRSSLRIKEQQQKQFDTTPISSNTSLSKKKNPKKRKQKVVDEEEEEEEDEEEVEEVKVEEGKEVMEDKKAPSTPPPPPPYQSQQGIVLAGPVAAIQSGPGKEVVEDKKAPSTPPPPPPYQSQQGIVLAGPVAAIQSGPGSAPKAIYPLSNPPSTKTTTAISNLIPPLIPTKQIIINTESSILQFYLNQFEEEPLCMKPEHSTVLDIIQWSSTEYDYKPFFETGYHPRIEGTLNEQQKEKIDEIKTNCEQIFNDVHEENYIEFKTFASLRCSTWISSFVVDAYSNLLNKLECNLRKHDSNRKLIKYVSSDVIATLESNKFSENRCRRCFNKNLFSKFHTIFFFANQKNIHWVLYKVVMAEKKIYLIDSLSKTRINEDQLKNVLFFFEINDKDNHKNTWKYEIEKENQNQNNGNDCGVFMLINSYFLAEFDSCEKYKNVDCAFKARLKIGIDLFQGNIDDLRIKKNCTDFSLDDDDVEGDDQEDIKKKEYPRLKEQLKITIEENLQLRSDYEILLFKFNELNLQFETLKKATILSE